MKDGGSSGHGFKKGQSGNPGGRPKGFAGISKMIREQTQDGAELVAHALAALRDDAGDWRDRAAARSWLGDYGFGKAPQTVTIESDSEVRPIDLTALTELQLEALAAIKIADVDEPEPAGTEH